MSTCLVRAIIAEARLSDAGRPLRLAIKRSPTGALQSHARVADARRVLIGGPIDSDMVSIVAWESAA